MWLSGIGSVRDHRPCLPWRNLVIPDRLLAMGFVLTLWIVLSAYFRLYHSRRLDSPFADAITLLKMGLASWIVLEGSAHLLPQLAPTPLFFLRFEAISTFTLVAARVALRLLVRELRRRGRNVKNLVLVATPKLGNRVAEKIEKRAYLGYRIVRQISCGKEDFDEAPRLVEALQNTLDSMSVEDVIIALPGARPYSDRTTGAGVRKPGSQRSHCSGPLPADSVGHAGL